MDLSNARWRKSSYSGTASDCVEVAFAGDEVATRDSKDPTGPALVFTRAEWAAFLTALRTGHLHT
ncbi:MAG TPA: DUF397 domain-containing protein [Mycobacteriales bacterium]